MLSPFRSNKVHTCNDYGRLSCRACQKEKQPKPPLAASVIKSNKALVDSSWVAKIHGNKTHNQLREAIIELAKNCGREIPANYWGRVGRCGHNEFTSIDGEDLFLQMLRIGSYQWEYISMTEKRYRDELAEINERFNR